MKTLLSTLIESDTPDFPIGFIHYLLAQAKSQTVIEPQKNPPLCIDDLELDCELVQTAPNEWTVLAKEPFQEGAFGKVYLSKKLILNSELNTIKRAENKNIIKVESFNNAQVMQEADTYVRLEHEDDKLPELQLQSLIKQKYHAIVEQEYRALIKQKIQAALIIKDDKRYLMMPYLGESLKKLIPTEKELLNFSNSFNMFYAILNDFFLLQKNQILHRDIKPGNICYTVIQTEKNAAPHYQCTIIDFGFAIDTSEKWQTLSGTRDYIAPELLHGQPASYASDIYALGKVARKIFYRLSLYPTAKLEPLELRDIENHHLDRDVVIDIWQFIESMYDKNPKNRPSLQMIQKFFAGIPYRQALNRRYKECFAEDTHYEFMHLPSHRQLIETHYSQSPTTMLVQDLYEKTENKIADLEAHKSRIIQSNDDKPSSLSTTFLGYIQSLSHLMQSDNFLPKTNSTGIRSIRKILSKADKHPMQLLAELKQLGIEKTQNSWSNRYSRSHFFGKGRSQDVEEFYHQLATLPIEEDWITTQAFVAHLIGLISWVETLSEDNNSPLPPISLF